MQNGMARGGIQRYIRRNLQQAKLASNKTSKNQANLAIKSQAQLRGYQPVNQAISLALRTPWTPFHLLEPFWIRQGQICSPLQANLSERCTGMAWMPRIAQIQVGFRCLGAEHRSLTHVQGLWLETDKVYMGQREQCGNRTLVVILRKRANCVEKTWRLYTGLERPRYQERDLELSITCLLTNKQIYNPLRFVSNPSYNP